MQPVFHLNIEWSVCVFVQEPAVQLSASEAELLWDGEPVLSVCGGLPQGFLREWGQTTVAQGLDADQVCAAFVCSARYKQEALIRGKVQTVF